MTQIYFVVRMYFVVKTPDNNTPYVPHMQIKIKPRSNKGNNTHEPKGAYLVFEVLLYKLVLWLFS